MSVLVNENVWNKKCISGSNIKDIRYAYYMAKEKEKKTGGTQKEFIYSSFFINYAYFYYRGKIFVKRRM